MTLARELIEICDVRCHKVDMHDGAAPVCMMFLGDAGTGKDRALRFLRTLAERGPSDRMHDAAYGEGSPIGHGANAVWDAMLRALIAEIEDER